MVTWALFAIFSNAQSGLAAGFIVAVLAGFQGSRKGAARARQRLRTTEGWGRRSGRYFYFNNAEFQSQFAALNPALVEPLRRAGAQQRLPSQQLEGDFAKNGRAGGNVCLCSGLSQLGMQL